MRLPRLRARVILTALLLVPAVRPGLAQDSAPASRPAPEWIARTVASLTGKGQDFALVVGTLRDGKPETFGFGQVSPAQERTPDGDTVFEIGSITKAFTGVLLAEMVGRGEVALDTPVLDLLPATARPEGKHASALQLGHLANHTSALPRLPANLRPKEPRDPYADYGEAALFEFVESWRPAAAPGEKSEYSNLGVGLLGHLLARKAGKSYEALLRERVLGPLGLGDTAITLDAGMKARMAQGHDAAGRPLPAWNFDALAAAGALRSTARDLLRLAGVCLAAPQGRLGEALVLSQQCRHQDPGSDARCIGLCWHRDEFGGKRFALVWHNGGTGGCHSFLGILPERRLAVVLLCARQLPGVDGVAHRLLTQLGDQPR
jgi:CubicO group peptidase (beta-lactamase class C family)